MINMVARWHDEFAGGIASLRNHGWYLDTERFHKKGISVVALEDIVSIPDGWPHPYEVVVRGYESQYAGCIFAIYDHRGKKIAPPRKGWPVFEAPEIVTVAIKQDFNMWAPSDVILIKRHYVMQDDRWLELRTEEVLRDHIHGEWHNTVWAPAIRDAFSRYSKKEV